MIVVRLDNPHIGAGPATVIARAESVPEYLAIAIDRDGARNRSIRLWNGEFPVGARVKSRLICGIGEGISSLIDEAKS